MSKNVYAKIRCTLLHIKKALGIFRELIPRTRRTTRVAFGDPPSGSKNVATISISIRMQFTMLKRGTHTFNLLLNTSPLFIPNPYLLQHFQTEVNIIPLNHYIKQ